MKYVVAPYSLNASSTTQFVPVCCLQLSLLSVKAFGFFGRVVIRKSETALSIGCDFAGLAGSSYRIENSLLGASLCVLLRLWNGLLMNQGVEGKWFVSNVGAAA